jgi:hypothetical protein
MTTTCVADLSFRNLATRERRRRLVLHGRILVIALLVLASGACARHSIEGPGRSVSISPDLTLVLPRPSDLGHAIEVTQLVTARYGSRVFAFEGHVSATPERFLMVGLDSLGRRAMTITWSDAAMTYEAASWLPPQLRPENVLADMVLLYWPEASVRQALAPSGGTVTAARGRRTITKDGEPVVQIQYDEAAADGTPWTGRLHYRNLAFHYELEVQSVRSSP